MRHASPILALVLAASGVAAQPDDPSNTGATLYADACARCHGDEGKGGKAPALSNPSMEAMTTAHNYARMLDVEDVDAAVVAIAAYLSPD